MSDSNEEQSSSDSSKPLLHWRPNIRPLSYRTLQEESSRVLAGFLATTSPANDRNTNISSKMRSNSPQRSQEPTTHTTASQPYIHIPKPIIAIDGAPDFPLILERLIREFCGRKKTRTLPCTRTLQTSKSVTSFRYEDAVTGSLLASSRYKYGQDKELTVVHVRRKPAMVNYTQGADGETNLRKLYSVWNGIRGWETAPSVVKTFGEEHSSMSTTPTAQIDIKQSQATILGSAELSISQRQAGKEAKEKIRLSLKRQRQWEEESEEDGSGALSLRSRTRRSSYIERPPWQPVSSNISEASTLIAPSTASYNILAGATAAIGTTTRSDHNISPSAQQLPPTPSSKPEMVSLTLDMQANTKFVFQAGGGARPRMANFADCDNITKLFNHARTAKLFRTWAEVVPLACRVNGGIEEICVMKGVPADFEEVVEAVKKCACWDTGAGDCVVAVKLAD